jgi:hypothetical protein
LKQKTPVYDGEHGSFRNCAWRTERITHMSYVSESMSATVGVDPVPSKFGSSRIMVKWM